MCIRDRSWWDEEEKLTQVGYGQRGRDPMVIEAQLKKMLYRE